MSTTSIIYSNDDDRAYGLAGMAISLAALDALDRVSSISLDGEDTMVSFSHEYYFSSSPSISPKASWNNLLSNYNLTLTMALSNVMSRWMVRRHEEVPADIMDTLYRTVVAEGCETCSLEEDEAETLYNRANTYMRRIFRNERLHPAIDEFVRVLSLQRSLTGHEIADELRLLQII